MRELVISDITEMWPGFCVIGVERVTQDLFRSIRPRPPRDNAWPITFPYGRGSVVQFDPAPTSASVPHIEDQNTHGLSSRGGVSTEVELVDFLRRAETGVDLSGLFECDLRNDTAGGNVWVAPDSAARSICGCQYKNVRFRVFEDPSDVKIRARLVLPSGEILSSLPVVDQAWRNLLYDFIKQGSKTRAPSEFESFLNRFIRPKLLQSPHSFARIGLARANPNPNKCWLMLDSLFPQPRPSWLSSL
jgi:hypothetical protein